MSHPLTDEQAAVVDAIRVGQNVTVSAYAGAGKTHTLVAAAKALDGKSGIFTAFNSMIVKESAAKFPASVTAKTSHSLATGICQGDGAWRWARMDKTWNRVVGRPLAQLLGVNDPIRVNEHITLHPTRCASIAVLMVDRYCLSGDEDIQWWHLPQINGVDDYHDRKMLGTALAPFARAAWADITNPRGRQRRTHNHYRKEWALTHPRIDADYILVDEAQDSAGVFIGVLKDQQKHGTQIITVGDQYQAINCQPIGTMVTVPGDPITTVHAGRVKCTVRECARQIDHRETNLCDSHERKRRAGTPVEALRGVPKRGPNRQVPIESLKVGDLVVTGHNSHVYNQGRPITAINRQPHDGEVVTITTESGLTSTYTPRHHCMVRIGDDFHGKHFVYLMGKGDQYRVGRTPAIYNGKNRGGFGPVMRAATEGADTLWLLSSHDTVQAAALAEHVAQAMFNIPGVRFRPTSSHDVLDVAAFWDKIGGNRVQAQQCLEHHGRLIESPLWTRGESRVGPRRHFVTVAANLMDGMLAFPLRNAKVRPGADHRGNPRGEILGTRDCWEPITVRRDYYCGDVVSLEVADHHTYFGDGIFTHNSWAGAVDAMDEFGGVQLSLTQSFRFGPALAEEANKWLSLMGAPKPLRGFDKVETTLGHLDAPNAVLFRTNGAVVEDLLKRLANNERVAMLGDTAAILYFVQSARDLQQKGWTSHHDLAAFQNWGQVQDYVEHDEAGADLKTMVKTIDAHGADVIEAALGRVTTPRYADVTLSTAHKVKGAEWSAVKIGGDFKAPKPDDDGRIVVSREAGMLAYVAITRAKDALDRGSLSWIDEALAESTTGRPAQAPIPVIDDIDSITVPAEPVKKVTFEDALTAHIAAHPRSALVRVKEWKVAITGTDGRVIGMGRGPASWFTIDGPADALDVREHHYRTEAEAHLGLVNA